MQRASLLANVRIGLISDTHGLLRPQAVEALRGSNYIIHAGDIGDAGVLERLSAIAPVTAVRGNNDRDRWAAAINHTEALRIGSVSIYVIHDLAELDIDPSAHGFQVVVSGHSHRPVSSLRDGVLFINPGSAGPRRFTLPVSLGRLLISGTQITPRLIELDVSR